MASGDPFECAYCAGGYYHAPACPLNPSNKPKEIVLSLDGLDFEVVQRAMAIRQRWRSMPDNGSNVAGSHIAEICRGWLDSIGEDVRPSLGSID
jgi:hypothetical protein